MADFTPLNDLDRAIVALQKRKAATPTTSVT
jgi:hypothetical protein